MCLGYTIAARMCVAAALLASTLVPGKIQAQRRGPATLRVAAAADLQPVMPILAQAYEKETGVKLEVSFGSSSALATQIVNGAPFDVFLGADFSFPEQVVAARLADGNEPVAYANGTLVLWARKDSQVQPISLERLTDGRVTRIAIADEFHAPYGRAAYAALRQLKLFDGLKSRLVVAENVSQTAQFVESGNAQMGFISLTLAESEHMKQVGTYVRVPAVYPKIRQCGVNMKNSPRLDDARKFLLWLTSPKVQEQLPRFGLTPAT